MRRFLAIFLLVGFTAGMSFAANSDVATKGDLKQMLQYLEKRFEQVDKRFEQVDKRFEQVDKRLDDLKYYLTGLIALATAALGYLILRVMKQEEKVSRLEAHRVDARDIASALFIADAETKKKLREALKL
ncbi:MAG: hypothetical protein JSR44_13465 [Spirochaetes bacterium]|nr:hypothetical protein [Spirochaetota bacterium]